MRVPTASFFQQQLAILNDQYLKIAKIYNQASSGKKIQRTSEDTVLAGQIKMTDDNIHDLLSYSSSGVSAQNRTALFESSIQSGLSSVGRIQELIMQVQNNDTLTDQNRVAIATELQGHLQSLLGAASTRDGNGEYIYSGFNTSSPPFIEQDGSYLYTGDLSEARLEIGLNKNIIYSESGFRVFGSIPTGNGTFTVGLEAANTGTVSTTAGAVVNNSNFIQDNYTLTFVTNGAGKMGYQVIGASSGQVIPLPPLTTPADAPDYVAGAAVTFSGISINVSGVPEVGDQLQIKPSVGESVFDTLSGLISQLQTPVGSNAVDKAKLSQHISQAAASFTQISDQLIAYQSEVGTRLSLVDNQINLNEKLITDQMVIIGKLQDADLVTIFSALSQQLAGLQATQESYSKIQNMLLQMLQI